MLSVWHDVRLCGVAVAGRGTADGWLCWRYGTYGSGRSRRAGSRPADAAGRQAALADTRRRRHGAAAAGDVTAGPASDRHRSLTHRPPNCLSPCLTDGLLSDLGHVGPAPASQRRRQSSAVVGGTMGRCSGWLPVTVGPDGRLWNLIDPAPG